MASKPRTAAPFTPDAVPEGVGESATPTAMADWLAQATAQGIKPEQALALIGAQPVWEPSSWRVTGFDIIPPARLGRPRVDVTLRISGFFRDAFPAQIELLDKAMRAVGALDEDEDDNIPLSRLSVHPDRKKDDGSNLLRAQVEAMGDFDGDDELDVSDDVDDDDIDIADDQISRRDLIVNSF